MSITAHDGAQEKGQRARQTQQGEAEKITTHTHTNTLAHAHNTNIVNRQHFLLLLLL